MSLKRWLFPVLRWTVVKLEIADNALAMFSRILWLFTLGNLFCRHGSKWSTYLLYTMSCHFVRIYEGQRPPSSTSFKLVWSSNNSGRQYTISSGFHLEKIITTVKRGWYDGNKCSLTGKFGTDTWKMIELLGKPCLGMLEDICQTPQHTLLAHTSFPTLLMKI